MQPAQLMSICPCRSFRRFFMDKRHLLLRHANRKQALKNIFFNIFLIRRIHLKFEGLFRAQQLEFIPGFGKLFFQFGRRHILYHFIAIQTDKRQKCISRQNFKLLSSARLKFCTKPGVSRTKIELIIIAPFLVRPLSQQIL